MTTNTTPAVERLATAQIALAIISEKAQFHRERAADETNLAQGLDEIIQAARKALTPSPALVSFQERVAPWMQQCFGPEISADRIERGDRLLEEVLELLQSGGYDPARVALLRDYVWGRPVGEPAQEVGGVMVTLAAYCLTFGLDMHDAGETELARINRPEIVEKIRSKQAAKAKAIGNSSPLPIAPAPVSEPVAGSGEAMREMCIAAVLANKKYEASDFPVCDSIVSDIRNITFPPSKSAAPTIPEGMKPWHGGDAAPHDREEGTNVLLRNGIMASTKYWPGGWRHRGAHDDIIAYTPVARPAAWLPDDIWLSIPAYLRESIHDRHLAALASDRGEVERLREALTLARPIVEAELEEAKGYADADWEGMTRQALEAIDAALNKRSVPRKSDRSSPAANPNADGVGEVAAQDGGEVERLAAENERLIEALTPSGETKYAYIDEFSWTEWLPDEDGIEQGHVRKVPWTTIKEIMAAIRERAALGEKAK